MHIYIPSRKRASTLRERTLAQIPKSWLPRTTIVVPEEDRSVYNAAFAVGKEERYPGLTVIVAPDGIAATRKEIGSYAENYHKVDCFLMLDDDLKFFQRKAPDDYHLLPTTEGQREIMLDYLSNTLLHYKHAAISSREGNNRLPCSAAPAIVETTRALRALAFQTDAFNGCEHGRVDVMEDFDIELQLLRKGYKNAVLAYWAHDQQMTNAAGGCSLYRTHDVQEASAKKLAELHPGFVNLREKENKTDKSGFGTRTEVTVYWKKAWESSP